MELKVSQINFEPESNDKNEEAYGKLLQAGCCLGGVSIGCAVLNPKDPNEEM